MRRKADSHKALWTKAFTFLLAFLLCVTPLTTGVATGFDPASLNANWGYYPTVIGNENGKFRIEGYFFNNNPGHDIGQFVNASMTLYNANNNAFCKFDINPDSGADRLIIPAGGTWNYRFNFGHDIDMEALNAHYNLSSFYAKFECTYPYFNCAGAGRCTVCADWRPLPPSPTRAPSPTWAPQPTRAPQPTWGPQPTRQCVRCGGDGKYECNLCDGGILFHKRMDSIDIGGGSSSYEVPVDCSACVDGMVSCWECGGDGWR